MATGGDTTQQGWPLQAPVIKPSTDAMAGLLVPPHRKPVGQGNSGQSPLDMPKRRPLSTAQGNANSIKLPEYARQQLPTQSEETWQQEQELHREPSFKTGDDEIYLRGTPRRDSTMNLPVRPSVSEASNTIHHPASSSSHSLRDHRVPSDSGAPPPPQHTSNTVPDSLERSMQPQATYDYEQHNDHDTYRPDQAVSRHYDSSENIYAANGQPYQLPEHSISQRPQYDDRRPKQDVRSWEQDDQRSYPYTNADQGHSDRQHVENQFINDGQSHHRHQPELAPNPDSSMPNSRQTSGGSFVSSTSFQPDLVPQGLQYHHQPFDVPQSRKTSRESDVAAARTRQASIGTPPAVPPHTHGGRLTPGAQSNLGTNLARPASAFSGASTPLRNLSPMGRQSRNASPSRLSPDHRLSFVDLLNVPYPQPPPAPTTLDNTQLRSAVGQHVTLLDTKKTLEMYRANVKKTNDPTVQYEFAVFMVNAAAEGANDEIQSKAQSDTGASSSSDLLRESRNILQKLSDRSYPFAQYYLADGYASGLFNKGVPDDERAFPLFIGASKHGHAEAGYRAALCYEFAWGCRKDIQKAVQYYRQSASKNHPGAMTRLGLACVRGDMGLVNRHREGLKWLRRGAESADAQYNSAPYELGLLHEHGFGTDVFQDTSYAAQLFTQSADLGHVEASYRLGDSYEHGKLGCPRDPALSVHFYTGAAQRGHAPAMMALCAWYMVGAEPVLEKDENEAYEWAKKAAEQGFPKAEYTVGYFTEMGIGCRRDPLEANVWYVKAADQGDERAKHRIAAIRAAASGSSGGSAVGQGPFERARGRKTPLRLSDESTTGKLSNGNGKKKWGIF